MVPRDHHGALLDGRRQPVPCLPDRGAGTDALHVVAPRGPEGSSPLMSERRDNSAGFDGSPSIASVPAALRRRKQWASNPSSDQRFALSRPPVIRLLPIIQMPDASDKRGVAVTFRPIDRFSLRFEGAEHMVRMVFDDIVVDTAPLRAALWARFNVNIRHTVLSLGSFC